MPAIYASYMLRFYAAIEPGRDSQHSNRKASPGMTAAAEDRLNDGQRDCLRLVLVHLNSKEIARELGVSPHTVDQRLRTAMRVLNAHSRFEAARIFATLDHEQAYQSLIYQAPLVARDSNNGNQDPSSARNRSETAEIKDDSAKAESGGALKALERSEFRHRPLPVPRFRGEKNRLAAVERLGWILVIAIGAALSFGGLISGLEALSRLKG